MGRVAYAPAATWALGGVPDGAAKRVRGVPKLAASLMRPRPCGL